MKIIQSSRGSPLSGVAIDSLHTKNVDDMFWVWKEDGKYLLQFFTPSISQHDPRVSPKKQNFGFTLGESIPAICLQFSISLTEESFMVHEFTVFECWAKNVVNLLEFSNKDYWAEEILDLLLPSDVVVMLYHAVVLGSTIRYCLFERSKDKKMAMSFMPTTYILFINIFIANFAIQKNIPMLFYKQHRVKIKKQNIGFINLEYPYCLSINAPLRRLSDGVNQCNLMAFFKKTSYPLDADELEQLVRLDGYSRIPPLIDSLEQALDVDNKIGKAAPVEQVKKETEESIVHLILHPVVNDDYISALEVTFFKANLSPPSYTFKDEKFGRIWRKRCVATCIDCPGSAQIVQADGSSKKEAKKYAARMLYIQLGKKYKQKVAF